jgi:hypothetical protein
MIVLRTFRAPKTKTGKAKSFSVPVDEALGLNVGDLVRVRAKGLDKGAIFDGIVTVLRPYPKQTVPRVEIPYNVGISDGEVTALEFFKIDTEGMEDWFNESTSKPFRGKKGARA